MGRFRGWPRPRGFDGGETACIDHRRVATRRNTGPEPTALPTQRVPRPRLSEFRSDWQAEAGPTKACPHECDHGSLKGCSTGGAWRHLSFELLAGLTHRIDKPDCQFTNAVGLAQFDGFLGDQVGADADRGGAGQNEVGDVELVDASGGDQWHLWKRRLERFDIRCASELGAGEDFDEVDTGFPRHHDLGWGESSGENDDLLLVRELHDLEIDPGGG